MIFCTDEPAHTRTRLMPEFREAAKEIHFFNAQRALFERPWNIINLQCSVRREQVFAFSPPSASGAFQLFLVFPSIFFLFRSVDLWSAGPVEYAAETAWLFLLPLGYGAQWHDKWTSVCENFLRCESTHG